jgi:hypothetical protein
MDGLDLLCVIYNAETLSLSHFSGFSLISPLHSLGLLRRCLLTWILRRRRLFSVCGLLRRHLPSLHVLLRCRLLSFPFVSVVGIAFTPLFSFRPIQFTCWLSTAIVSSLFPVQIRCSQHLLMLTTPYSDCPMLGYTKGEMWSLSLFFLFPFAYGLVSSVQICISRWLLDD